MNATNEQRKFIFVLYATPRAMWPAFFKLETLELGVEVGSCLRKDRLLLFGERLVNVSGDLEAGFHDKAEE
jgi:hypothetical protein